MKKFNLKLNPEKCEFRRDKVTYVGHELSKAGVRPDPEKIRAVQEMKPPGNVKELMTFFLDFSNIWKNQIARNGLPKFLLTTDHSSAAKSSETLARHVTSSPHFPQANGQVERTIRTVKNLLRIKPKTHTKLCLIIAILPVILRKLACHLHRCS